MSVPLKKRYKRLHSKLKGDSQTDLYLIEQSRTKAWKSYYGIRDVILHELEGTIQNKPDESEVSKALVGLMERITKRSRLECTICNEEMEENLSATPCSHLFHTNCITKWIKEFNHSTCPICRDPIELENCHVF